MPGSFLSAQAFCFVCKYDIILYHGIYIYCIILFLILLLDLNIYSCKYNKRFAQTFEEIVSMFAEFMPEALASNLYLWPSRMPAVELSRMPTFEM